MIPIYVIFEMNAYLGEKKNATRNKSYSRPFIASEVPLVYNNKYYSISFILLGFRRQVN